MDASDRVRQFIAVVMGGLFVASGLVVMFGESDLGRSGSLQSEPFYEMLRDLTGLIGPTASGCLLIGFGACLTAWLFRVVKQ